MSVSVVKNRQTNKDQQTFADVLLVCFIHLLLTLPVQCRLVLTCLFSICSCDLCLFLFLFRSVLLFRFRFIRVNTICSLFVWLFPFHVLFTIICFQLRYLCVYAISMSNFISICFICCCLFDVRSCLHSHLNSNLHA